MISPPGRPSPAVFSNPRSTGPPPSHLLFSGIRATVSKYHTKEHEDANMGDSEIQIASCEILLQCTHLPNVLQANLCCLLCSCLDGEQKR